MYTRRKILKSFGAMGVGVALAPTGLVAAAKGQSSHFWGADLVVTDKRFGLARSVGSEVSRQGPPVFSVDGDINELWLEKLNPLWRERKSVIAGITDESCLFCLEQLGRDQGMHVVFRFGGADFAGRQGIEIKGSPKNIQKVLSVLRGGQWDAASVTELLLRADKNAQVPRRLHREVLGDRRSFGDEQWVSWVMVPRDFKTDVTKSV